MSRKNRRNRKKAPSLTPLEHLKQWFGEVDHIKISNPKFLKSFQRELAKYQKEKKNNQINDEFWGTRLESLRRVDIAPFVIEIAENPLEAKSHTALEWLGRMNRYETENAQEAAKKLVEDFNNPQKDIEIQK